MTGTLAERVDAYVAGVGRGWGEAYAMRGVIAVAREGDVVLARELGAGMDARFRIASLTKPITAAAVLALVDEGRLSLGDRLDRFVPGFPAPARDVTILQLLTHRSGIATYSDEETIAAFAAAPRTREEVLARFRHRPPRFAAGTTREYSNSNYFLLGLVIEAVTGAPYEDEVRRAVLARAGMLRTTARAPGDALPGHTIDDDERLAPPAPCDPSVPFAAGMLWSTANDLLAFDRALTGALLSDTLRARMHDAGNGYAMAWGVSQRQPWRLYVHGGGMPGFRALIVRAPLERCAIVVLCDCDAIDVDAIGLAVTRMALGDEAVPPPAPPQPAGEDVRDLAGVWRLDDASRARATASRSEREARLLSRLVVEQDGARAFTTLGDVRQRAFRDPRGALFTKVQPYVLEREGDALLLRGELALRYERSG